MVEGYQMIKDVAAQWGISERRIQILCSNGRIEGAEKVGRAWLIPVNAQKPDDGRVTTGNYRKWRKKYSTPKLTIKEAEE